jgi:predicted translin family RNA/ssDNA-binding protein
MERLVKTSRDITIGSKRLIFLLHRCVHFQFPLTNFFFFFFSWRRAFDEPENKQKILEEANTALTPIHQNIAKVAKEIEGQDYFRYQRAFSPGLQEYIEAISFKEFIETGTLLTKQRAEEILRITEVRKFFFFFSFGTFWFSSLFHFRRHHFAFRTMTTSWVWQI